MGGMCPVLIAHWFWKIILETYLEIIYKII